jgi:hypothetical protein
MPARQAARVPDAPRCRAHQERQRTRAAALGDLPKGDERFTFGLGRQSLRRSLLHCRNRPPQRTQPAHCHPHRSRRTRMIGGAQSASQQPNGIAIISIGRSVPWVSQVFRSRYARNCSPLAARPILIDQRSQALNRRHFRPLPPIQDRRDDVPAPAGSDAGRGRFVLVVPPRGLARVRFYHCCLRFQAQTVSRLEALSIESRR